MKWFPFTVLLIAFVVCQTTLVQAMAVNGVWPEWTFVLAIHYALWAPWPEGAIAAWLTGFLVDLQSSPPDPVGLHALCYGTAAWIVMRMRHVLFRDHPFTHAVVTLVFCFLLQGAIGLYHAWKHDASLGVEGFWKPALFISAYTALWSPCLCWLLLRMQRWTALGPNRRRSPYRAETPV